MKLYEFAILYHPTAEQRKKGQKDEIVVKPTTILAQDERTATLTAAREIPEKYMDQLDQIEVAIRPF
jgi:hypothetical protein